MSFAERPVTLPAVESSRLLPKETLRSSERNTYHLLTSGREIIDRTVNRIGKAKYSIDLQYYTFEADETGQRVIDALITAKRKATAEGRNLQIRILADNSIRMFHDGKSARLSKSAREKREETYAKLLALQNEGIQVKITNYFDFYLLHSNPAYRDHKKIAIFDGENPDPLQDPEHTPTAVIGSANISNHHYIWKDIAVEMSGNMVPIIQDDFNETFTHAKDFARVFDVPRVRDYIQENVLKNHPLGWADIPRIIRSLPRYIKDARVAIVRNDEGPGWRKVYDLKEKGDGKGGVVATDGSWQSPREGTLLAKEVLNSLQEGDRIDVCAPFPGMFRTSSQMINAVRRRADVHFFTGEHNPYTLYERHLRFGPISLPNPIASTWEYSLKQRNVFVHTFQGKEKESVGTVHAKFFLVRPKDKKPYVLWGSSNFTSGIASGMNREIVIMTDDANIVNQFIDFVDTDLTKHSVLQQKGWRRTQPPTSTDEQID